MDPRDDPHDPLADARPGQRWVVRHRLDDGRATDSVGWVDTLAGPDLVLVRGERDAVAIRRARVLAARRAPAASGGPDPRRTTAAVLEHLAASAWLAENAPLGEWLLRSAGGFTARANSCLAVGDPGLPIGAAADRIRAWSADHGIAPLAQVIRDSAEAAALAGVGWVPAGSAADVLAIRLADLLGDADPPAGVILAASPEPIWRALYERSRPGGGSWASLVLAGRPRTDAGAAEGHPGDGAASHLAFARSEENAIARGHLAGNWLGLSAIWTAPEARGRGLAGALVAALGHWAARRGARYAYLQVATANPLGRRRFEHLGFRRHHSYGYLAPPEPG